MKQISAIDHLLYWLTNCISPRSAISSILQTQITFNITTRQSLQKGRTTPKLGGKYFWKSYCG